jgi:hypothetical protein
MKLDEHPAIWPYLAGAAGSIVSLRWMPGASWFDRALSVISGALCAGICTPWLVDRFELGGEAVHAVVAFGLGLFGLAVLSAVREGIEAADLKGIVTRLIRGRLGGSSDEGKS